MRCRVSLSTRLVRSLTALVTVWCLGCSSYEPLLSGLGFGTAGMGMECGSEGAMDDGAMAVRSSAAERTAVADPGVSSGSGERSVTAAASESARGYDCGCQSCHAASPTEFTFIGSPASTPDVPLSTPVALSSVAQQPLVPPPQSAL
jgi:hypothetical protein